MGANALLTSFSVSSRPIGWQVLCSEASQGKTSQGKPGVLWQKTVLACFVSHPPIRRGEISSVENLRLSKDEGCSPHFPCLSLLGWGQAKIPCKGDPLYLDPNTCAVNVVLRSSLYILMRLPDNFKKIHCDRILCDAVKIPLHLSIFLGKISVLIVFKCSSWPQTRALNRVVQVVVARKCFMPVHKLLW